jgi:two-component system, sensor histidine kinase and response regulator
MDTAGSIPVLNRIEALRRVRGNEKLYRTLITTFLSDLPRLLTLLRTGVEQQSAQEVHDAAHSLKGCASHLGAEVVAHRAWILEKIGHDGDVSEAEYHFLLLEQELQQLTPVLQSLLPDTLSADGRNKENAANS